MLCLMSQPWAVMSLSPADFSEEKQRSESSSPAGKGEGVLNSGLVDSRVRAILGMSQGGFPGFPSSWPHPERRDASSLPSFIPKLVFRSWSGVGKRDPCLWLTLSLLSPP